MIQKALQLYCGNEHGFGDVTFPADEIFNPALRNARVLRREAKKAGWGRVGREDYCEGCMENFREEAKVRP